MEFISDQLKLSLDKHHSFIHLQIMKWELSERKVPKYHPAAVALYLPAGWTEAVLVCPDAMPAETADLVAAGTREEVDVIDLQRLHTQRALHGVFLQLRATGHLIALVQGRSRQLARTRRNKAGKKRETQRGEILGRSMEKRWDLWGALEQENTDCF